MHNVAHKIAHQACYCAVNLRDMGVMYGGKYFVGMVELWAELFVLEEDVEGGWSGNVSGSCWSCW